MFDNNYNSGANQFSGSQIGGGGFMQNNNENYNSSNKPKAAMIPYEQRKLSQITIKQIITAPPPQPEENLMVDGVEISQICMVAMVESVDVQSSHTTLTLNDYTASIEAKQWSNDQLSQQQQFNEGSWVRVNGRINHFNGKCSINVFNIEAIKDFNQITHHFLECIYSHLLNKNGLPQTQRANNNNNNGSFGGNNNVNNSYNNNSNNGGFGGGNNQNNGLSMVQNMVLNIIQSPQFEHSETGCDVQVLFERLQNEDVNDIRTAIDELANAGHIYSTIDDDHYKSSGNC